MTEEHNTGRRRSWEILTLVAIAALAGWLRLRDLDLVEFKLDEAVAVDLARRVLDGDFLTVGLRSSVGAYNPPLFVYLTALPLAVWDDPLAATSLVGVLAVAAVTLTYVALRPRFGALVALGASALFSTAPWAVLYGRKLWGQSVLPIVTVLLLWTLFAVLERSRSRAVGFVPILVCVAFQLNFSALAVAVPATAALLYRAREVNWRMFVTGVGVAALLLAPWLYHEVGNGFADVSLLLSEPPGSGESNAASAEAARQSIHLTGVGDWVYVAGDSMASFVSDAGPTWKVARGASLIAATLFVLGIVMCMICVVRSASTTRRWPWIELAPGSAARVVLLVWLAGIWVTYATPTTHLVYPHYLIVTFPVSFAVQALVLRDLVGLVPSGLRRVATVAAIATLVLIAAAYIAFTVSFHRFVDDVGGTSGDYGVVYRDKAELAELMRGRGLRAANEPVVDFLVNGDLTAALGERQPVQIRNRFHDPPLSCSGELQSFGLLSVCLPEP